MRGCLNYTEIDPIQRTHAPNVPTERDNQEEKERGDPGVVQGQKAQGGPAA